MRTNRMIILALALILALSCGGMSRADTGRLDITLELTSLEVSTMPLAVRNVPAHPNDGHPAGIGPVSRLEFPARSILTAGWTIKRVDRGPSSLSIGARLILHPTRETYDNAERNYTNAPGTDLRGYGAALTFVGLEAKGLLPSLGSEILDSVLNLTPELRWEAPLARHTAKTITFSLSYFRLQAVNGWDRYDNLEVRDTYTLAHCFPIGVEIKARKQLTVGLRYYPLIKTSLGREAGLESGFGMLTRYAF